MMTSRYELSCAWPLIMCTARRLRSDRKTPIRGNITPTARQVEPERQKFETEIMSAFRSVSGIMNSLAGVLCLWVRVFLFSLSFFFPSFPSFKFLFLFIIFRFFISLRSFSFLFFHYFTLSLIFINQNAYPSVLSSVHVLLYRYYVD